MAKKEFEQEPMLEETSGEMMLEETSDDSTMLEESSTDVILEEASDSPTMLEESSATSETLLEETSTSPKTKAVKEDKQKAKETEKKVEDAGKRKAERKARKEAEEAEKKREATAEKKKAEEAARRKAAEEEEKRAERRREEEKAKAKAEKTKYIWIVIGSHIAGFLLIAVFNYIYSLFDSDSGLSWKKMTLAVFLFLAAMFNYFVFNDQRKEGHVFQSVLHFCIGTAMLLIGGIWLWMRIKSALPPNEEELKTELMTRYDSIYNVGKDKLRIVEKDGKKGLVDKRGNEKFTPQYDEILEPLEKEELITVKRDEKEEIQKRLFTTRIVISSGKKGLLLTGEKNGDDVSNSCCDTRFVPQYDSIYYDVESKQWRAMQY